MGNREFSMRIAPVHLLMVVAFFSSLLIVFSALRCALVDSAARKN